MIRPILNLELQGACTGASGSTLDLSLTTVTGLSASIDVKDSVRLATAAVLPNSPTYLDGVLTAGTNSTLTVDGSVCALNDRVLVKNQAATANNGIYYLSQLGSGAAPWKLTRALDFNLWTEIPGSVVSVEAGTVNAGTQWLCNVVAGGTIGSTAISFVVPKNFVDLTTSQTVTGQKTFVAPELGAATATSINGITITAGGSGTLTMQANINTGSSGGSIDTGNQGGNINTCCNGGDIDTSEVGGSISTTGNASNGLYPGGSINTAGGAASVGGNINTSGSGSSAGGDINTSSGGSINTNNGGGNISTFSSGGSINTSAGGGSIDTTGTGSIELGITGTRTFFRGNAATTDKTIDLPNLTGTVVVTAATSATATQALFAQATGFPAYRAIAATDLPGTLSSGTAITNAALTTPVLGTPSSGVMNNLTGILRGLAAQETVASYNGVALTGTMYFANGTAVTNGTLTGIGTLFTTEAKVGDRIATASSGDFGAQGGPFFVKSIASNTSLTLSKSGNAAQQGSGNAVSAKIFRSLLTAQSAAGANLVTISADGTFILGTLPSSLSSGAFAAAGADATFNYVNLAGNRLYSSGGWRVLQTYNGSANVDIGLSESGTTAVHTLTVASTLAVTLATTMTGLLTANGGITTVGGSNLLTTNTNLTDHSSGNTASIGNTSNAPVPGDPSKWIAINDNGTTRYIPTW